ncbi:hypothetical protein NDU88_007078 [Pleurodeles waltl]|uniref:Uncharacterized protein n=1 Tax=Pleurodeles waltl TaxID=8319 RepID=A0AAV7QNN0_PLEWA|nr:hypothetical protein NDU88_007078 [Pleurodeles waltl]
MDRLQGVGSSDEAGRPRRAGIQEYPGGPRTAEATPGSLSVPMLLYPAKVTLTLAVRGRGQHGGRSGRVKASTAHGPPIICKILMSLQPSEIQNRLRGVLEPRSLIHPKIGTIEAGGAAPRENRAAGEEAFLPRRGPALRPSRTRWRPW